MHIFWTSDFNSKNQRIYWMEDRQRFIYRNVHCNVFCNVKIKLIYMTYISERNI